MFFLDADESSAADTEGTAKAACVTISAAAESATCIFKTCIPVATCIAVADSNAWAAAVGTAASCAWLATFGGCGDAHCGQNTQFGSENLPLQGFWLHLTAC